MCRFIHIGRVLLVLAFLVCSPLKGQDFLGTFLAAEYAVDEYRYDVAEGFIKELPDEAFENPEVLELALKAYVGTGDIVQAIEIANDLLDMESEFVLARIVNLIDLFKRYDYDAVITSVEETQLNFPLTALFKGWATFGEGSVEKSLEIFQEEMGEDAGFLRSFSESLILASTGDYQMALDTLGIVTNYPPALQNEVLFLRVQILLKQGKHDLAKEEYDLLILSDIEPRKVPFLKLDEYFSTGDTSDLNVTFTAQEGMAKLLSSVARISTNNSDASGDSLALFRLASYLNPDDITLDFAASFTLLYLESYELALRPLAGILPGNPYFLASSALQAEIYYEMGDINQSMAIVEQALELKPNSIGLWAQLGELYYFNADYTEAIDSISRAIEIAQEDNLETWNIYYWRGNAYYFLKDWENAEIDWRSALELSPDNALILNNLGYTLADQNIKLDEAEDFIRKAVELEPDNGYYVDSLGWILYRRGKLAEALENLQKADRITPNEPEVIDHIAEVYWVMGEEDLAKREWRRALELEPQEPLKTKIQLKLTHGLEEGIRMFEEQ